MAAPSIPSGTRLKCSRSMRRRSAPISLVGLFSLETTPWGIMGKRERQTILKRTSARLALSLGAKGIHRQIKRLE